MQTRLTLRLDESLIRKAKRFSKKSGKSVSKLVADYLNAIPDDAKTQERELTPRVRSLMGVLASSPVTEEDYRRHLEARHR